jgi:hypothetical protein
MYDLTDGADCTAYYDLWNAAGYEIKSTPNFSTTNQRFFAIGVQLMHLSNDDSTEGEVEGGRKVTVKTKAKPKASDCPIKKWGRR